MSIKKIKEGKNNNWCLCLLLIPILAVSLYYNLPPYVPKPGDCFLNEDNVALKILSQDTVSEYTYYTAYSKTPRYTGRYHDDDVIPGFINDFYKKVDCEVYQQQKLFRRVTDLENEVNELKKERSKNE